MYEVTVHEIDLGQHKNNKKSSDGKLDKSHCRLSCNEEPKFKLKDIEKAQTYVN